MNPDTEQVNSQELPVWNQNIIPTDAQVIILVNEPNYDFGGELQAAYRLDINRIVANNAYQGNSYSLLSVDADINIPDRTIVPGYVESFAPYGLKRAQASSATTRAQFLILSTNQNVDDAYIVQSSGFYTFPEGHDYSIGTPYYLSDSAAGGVTTVAPPNVVQKLFVPIDANTIQILIGL